MIKKWSYFFEQVDICDFIELNRVCSEHKLDSVMHLAAESHADRSISEILVFIRTNILGTHALLKSSLTYWNKLNNKCKTLFRFHYISTDEVYGKLNYLIQAFTEKTPYSLSNPYQLQKLLVII
ncbi:dTDP-glucose 4,6-dehydratase 2 [Candidatus Photodesmus katoptron]|uniref:dTDP-glucose 4,6-dehydratase n=1 Tax=Candidatus Photodesmus katoptron Akat1 TaxID=1236703 RepID=S3EIH2_9GAMM|nr:dTDP-glucose 4,6-dehydratase [Candidatus Photodesmus katoptron Akat1]KEY90281.1 dTDP-glucose 4,6-dehydratase 2 [Candidatus Photodesmus katoptron]